MTNRLSHLRKLDEYIEATRIKGLAPPYDVYLERDGLILGFYAPQGTDPQSPHDRDEIYIVSSGRGTFQCDEDVLGFKTGDLLFVPAGAEHRFREFTEDFRAWVVFFRPQ